MRFSGTSWLALALLCGASASTSDAAPPNIVFFLVDDLGWADLGCYGSTFYETPNLDRMASQGARFTNAYAACPVCSPTRASIMTGKYPVRTDITDYIGAAQPENWDRNTKHLPAPYATQMEHEEVTLAEALKEGGYATYFAGKWHLGPEGYWPEDQGFDINKGGIDAGSPPGGGRYFSPYGNPRLDDGPKGEHLPARLCGETARFIEDHKDQPFLTYFSFYSVHTPLMTLGDLEQKYIAKRKRMGLEEKWGREGERDVRLVQEHAVYAGMIESMDQAVGTVLDKLDELGIADNTVVFFTSDNGGLSTSEGWPTSNLPLRGGKGWLYEGGIREPLLVRWPGTIPPGTVIDTPVISTDYYPTILSIAGLPQRPEQHLDGVNLHSRRLRRGETQEPRSLFWHYPRYGNQGGAPGAVIRKGNWKLIEWFENDEVELFNLAEDEGESHNLAATMPDRVRALCAELDAWQAETGARLSTPNPAYDPSRPSGRAATRPGSNR